MDGGYTKYFLVVHKQKSASVYPHLACFEPLKAVSLRDTHKVTSLVCCLLSLFNNKMKKYIIAGASFLLPAIAFAQVPTGTYLSGILSLITNLIQTATPIVIGLAMLFFLYGLMRFVLAAGNEDAKDTGKRIMIWGIIALFVMVSVWGLVQLLNQETGVAAGGGATLPSTP